MRDEARANVFRLAAIDDPTHPEHNHRTNWIGGSFDPDRFDITATNAVPGGLAWSNG